MDLVFRPGIVKETTPYDVGQGFVDCNLIRWRNRKAATVNGWYQRNISFNPQGVCRAIHEFSTLSGVDIVAFGTNSNLYIMISDTMYDITPAGFSPGSAYAEIADGYGIGTYGTPGYSGGGFGLPRIAPTDIFSRTYSQPLIWSLDNFGEDLIGCPYAGIGSGGPIYIWDGSGSFSSPATLLSSNPSAVSVPVVSRGVFVMPQAETIFAVGCNPIGYTSPDPMQIRWSDFTNPYDWQPTASNAAGGYRLPSGSYIVGWLNTYYETLFFTDTTVYSAQLLTNGLVFSFNPVGSGMSMISPKAAYSDGSVTRWMDNGSFYQYSGTVTELECPLKSFLFGNGSTVNESSYVTGDPAAQTGDIDKNQAFKIFAAGNHSYSETWWFYQSVNSDEIDSYVMYNQKDGLWANGRLSRTAWSDSGHLDNPIAIDSSGNVYMHEFGTDQQLLNGTFALPYSLTTGDFCNDQGDAYTLLQRIIPDFEWQGNGGNAQWLNLAVRVKESSNSVPRYARIQQISPNTNNRGYYDMKVRGRRLSLEITSSGVPGTAWTMGNLQAQGSANGNR